jgi:hypothetical protein
MVSIGASALRCRDAPAGILARGGAAALACLAQTRFGEPIVLAIWRKPGARPHGTGPADLIARLGADAFVVWLAGTDEFAAERAEQFRCATPRLFARSH